MRKTLAVLVAVAIIGTLAFLITKKDSPPAGVAGSNTSESSTPSKNYKDGTYTGTSAETPYGSVQIAVVINGGKISDVNFLQMPSADARSVDITSFAKPSLKQNTLNAQGPNIDFVTGATSTSYGYKESLQAALDKAAGTSWLHDLTTSQS